MYCIEGILSSSTSYSLRWNVLQNLSLILEEFLIENRKLHRQSSLILQETLQKLLGKYFKISNDENDYPTIDGAINSSKKRQEQRQSNKLLFKV